MNIRSFGILFAAAFVAILVSCQAPLGVNPSDIAASSPDPVVAVDPARGLAVFTEADGSESPISGDEDGVPVVCVEVTDFIVVGDRESSSGRHAGGRTDGVRALVLGVRDDGYPGIWIVLHNGIVVIPESDEGDMTSRLLGIASDTDGLHWTHGWDYTAMELSTDGRIIVGRAINEDAAWLEELLGTTPEVAVWWNIRITDSGRIYLSRARAIAEYPEWEWEELRGGGRGHRWNWWIKQLFDRFGLWFFAWADAYMVSPLSEGAVETLETDLYLITGYGPEGKLLEAMIDPWKVLSIEEAEVSGNTPPNPVAGVDFPEPLYYEFGKNKPGMVYPEVADEWDDDGDPVTFVWDPASLRVEGDIVVSDSLLESLRQLVSVTDTGVVTVGYAPPATNPGGVYSIIITVRTFDGELYSDSSELVLTLVEYGS